MVPRSFAPPVAARACDRSLLLVGAEARARILDPVFAVEWRARHARRPGATVYQSPEFCSAWYECYAPDWVPVAVLRYSADGRLCGAWFLARHAALGTLTHAGAHQAEYHTWLHEPGDELDFVADAWRQITGTLGVRSLRLRYFPSAEDGARLARHPALSARVEVREVPRPLMRLDADEVAASFAKKSNRSRFNRLARIGPVTFERVHGAEGFESVIGDLEACYDLRQDAANGVAPFRADPRKRAFHRRLMEAAGDETHVTVTRVGAQTVAGLWGQRSGDVLHLGLLFHSPLLAEHSPGKLHVMRLSEHLLREGFTTLDLTPGGDPWKERFANAHDVVAEIVLHASPLSRLRTVWTGRLRRVARRVLSRVGITPERVRKVAARLQPDLVATAWRRARRWWGETREFRAYRMDRAAFAAAPSDARIHRNDLTHLLAFTPSERWHRRREFLGAAMERLEAGQAVYTACTEGRLAHFGWLALRQTQARLTEVDYVMPLPPGSATMYDFYTHPEDRGQGLYRASLRRMLGDAFADQATESAWIFVLADNVASRRAIEATGFRHVGTSRLTRRFGRRSTVYEPEEVTGPSQGRT